MSRSPRLGWLVEACFSRLLRQLRAGQSIVTEYRGEPVTETRRIEPAEPGHASRLVRLKVEGPLHPQVAAKRALRPLAARPGALNRFPEDRA